MSESPVFTGDLGSARAYVLRNSGKPLADRSPMTPEIMGKGLPLAATRYDGERFPGVGQHEPIASDHCPVVMEISLG